MGQYARTLLLGAFGLSAWLFPSGLIHSAEARTLTGVTVAPSSAGTAVGQTQLFRATGRFSDGFSRFLSPTTPLSAGFNATCTVALDGRIFCWGTNSSGQVGHGSYEPTSTPVEVRGIGDGISTDGVSVSIYDNHACALRVDRTVWCWGSNDNGQLGAQTRTNPSSNPVPVRGITNALDVAVGDDHSCARLGDRRVQCWGSNVFGTLGHGALGGSETPVDVIGITTAIALSAGLDHTCALLADGTVRCWGDGGRGQLGNGATQPSATPVTVFGISNATDISAGRFHTCARLADGRIRCWGHNLDGQLGNGATAESSTTPVTAQGIEGAIDVGAGSRHSCALLADGTVRCWGANESGQLGDGTTTPSLTPVPVLGLADAATIDLGGSHSCAILVDGTLRCWGNNYNGKLGNGTTTDSPAPVQVSRITNGTGVVWRSTNEAVATVDSNGRATGRGPGTTTISATAAGVTGTASLTVTGVAKPDLIETAVSNPPSTISGGGTFSVTDTTKNQGSATAGPSTTRFYLSAELKNSGDVLLSGTRVVPSLAANATSSGTTTVTVPSSTPAGRYYLLGCADDTNTVEESSGANNCLASSSQVQVGSATGKPDLIETFVSNPPASGAPGSTFTVRDTVKNQGAGPAGPSTTIYALSTDRTYGAGDIGLGGARSVGPLDPGATSTGSATVEIGSQTPSGRYYLIACADGNQTVEETSGANNCLASSTVIDITGGSNRPDLVVTTVSNPPPTIGPGGSRFNVTDTTKNQGRASAGSSTTRYYLSTDTVKDTGDRLLQGGRPIPTLAPGASSTGTVNVMVPYGTPIGTYYVLACADDTNVVEESSGANNCRASSTTTRVAAPDLVETAVSNPPPTIRLGRSFTVTDTARNQGTATAGPSTTRYYLSTDTIKSGTDRLLSGSRSVPSLAAGVSSSGTATVTVPTSTASGAYYLLACADDTNTVAESDGGNNCRASGTRVQVSP